MWEAGLGKWNGGGCKSGVRERRGLGMNSVGGRGLGVQKGCAEVPEVLEVVGEDGENVWAPV